MERLLGNPCPYVSVSGGEQIAHREAQESEETFMKEVKKTGSMFITHLECQGFRRHIGFWRARRLVHLVRLGAVLNRVRGGDCRGLNFQWLWKGR